MAISLSDNLAIGTAAAADVRYGVWSGSTIAAAIVQANGGIGTGLRFAGLTVGILDTNLTTNPTGYVVEYWYQLISGTLTLVEKTSGGTVGGTGTVNAIPYWSATDTLSDSAASHFNSKRVDVKSNLHLLGQGGDLGAQGYLRFESGDQVNHVGFYGPGNGLDSDSYDLFLPTTLPSVTNQILESNASGSLSWIPTPTGGVTGSGTVGRIPRWSTTANLGDSSIDEVAAGEVNFMKAGGTAATDSALFVKVDTGLNVGVRTISPQGALDVNGNMRARAELNVGFANEQNLFVQGFTTSDVPIAGKGFVKMGSYGQNIFTGHPTQPADAIGALDRNLRTSTGFGKTGIVVDSYIYDTFEITLAALEQLGDNPTDGQLLIDTPADLMCVVSDFWFYREINEEEGGVPSSQGTWQENVDLVVYPSTDLSQMTIKDPYEQQYFKVSYNFLHRPGIDESASQEEKPCSALYQSNINGDIPTIGQAGAWQIGPTPTTPPSGNKVYLSTSTGSPSPAVSFPAGSATRFFMGIKYRFLMLANGIKANEDLIVIDAVEYSTHKYDKCLNANSDPNCANMPPSIYITVDPGNPQTAVFENNNTGYKCCYAKKDGLYSIAPTANVSIAALTFDSCSSLPEFCTAATVRDVYVRCENAASRACEGMDGWVGIESDPSNPAYAILQDASGNICCYAKSQTTALPATTGYSIYEFRDPWTCKSLPRECN